jgi:hypothetical protein
MDQTLLGHVLDAVADLSPGPQTPAGDLDLARAAVARAAASGQSAGFALRDPVLARAVADDATRNALFGVLDNAIRAQAAPQRIVRRTEPTAMSASPLLGATRSEGRAVAATHGPFVDRFGVITWIDVFDVLQVVGIQRQGGVAPFAYVEVVGALGASDTLKLGAGSVWFAANALVAGAPAGGFVGLRIKSGTVTFGTTIPLAVSPIVVPPTATVTFALELDSPAPASGTGPGADARQAKVLVPARASIAVAPGASTITHLDGAALDVFGTALTLKYAGAPFFYDAFQNRVAAPCEVDVHAFAASDSRSSLVKLTGTAPIVAAAWSLPIAIVAPADLGPAAGAGGIALALGAGLEMTWQGRDASAACGPAELVAEPSSLRLASLVARTSNIAQQLQLWNAGGAARGALDLRFPKPFAFTFVSATAGAEAFAFLAPLMTTFDRPRTINNDRVRFRNDVTLVELLQSATETLVVIEALAPESARTSVQSYALKNLVLNATDPLGLLVVGKLGGDGLVNGVLVLQFMLHFALPILPDPYAANIAFDPRRLRERLNLGAMFVVVRWQPPTAPTLDVLLPPNALARVNRLPQPVAAAPAVSNDAKNLAALTARFEQVAPLSLDSVSLLDVSTNVSLFGVTLDPAARAQSPAGAPAPAPPAPAVKDLLLEITGLGVHVMTLPAVQFEPVLTPDDSTSTPRPFPSPLTFDDTGSPTVFATDAVELVPAAPRPAIDAMLAGYRAPLNPNRVAIRFNLPFGIAAVAELDRSHFIIFPSPSLGEVAPHFAASGMSGGDQLSVQAARPLLLGPGSSESPSLAGMAVQLHNAGPPHVPPVTVLSPIDATWDSTFGPGALNPRVPVPRIDFSGFGESLFSDWRSPDAVPPTISKAQFHVMVGRTALEVVQAFSVLYPYAVRVVRTITIERTNGAAIVRHDSGWQAVSDGFYAFPEPGLVVHPGIVRGVTRVGNIRDTGQFYTTKDADAIQLMAVRFDCDVQMENAVAGAGPNGVLAHDQLGYVQLTRVAAHAQLLPSQYANLLADVGALGGPVDCVVDIGGSRERMRVGRVDVGATSAGGPDFAMAAWGSPHFPGGGQWSFLRQGASDVAPQPVDHARGVPVVRAGPSPAAPPPDSPYRFADPADLLTPASPAADYGILHATGTQRTLFPRPKIEAGSHALTSTRPPLIADPYVLSTATGLFPRTDACIPFPDAAYSLDIAPDGNLKLTPTSHFTTPVIKRVLHESDVVRTVVYCNDEAQVPNLAVVTLAIDTAAALPWSFKIDNLSVATESGKHGEISRVVGNVHADAASPAKFASSRFIFGPPLQPVQKVVSFLESFGALPPLNVSMTNDFQVKVGLKIDINDLLDVLGPAGDVLKKFVDDFDFSVLEQIAPTNSAAEAEFELVIKVPTPFEPIVAIGIAKFTIKISTDFGEALVFMLGVGVGVDFSIGPFEAKAYYAQTQFLITGDTVFGLGAGAIIKGSVDLKIVSIDVSVEAKVALLSVTCGGGSTIWGVAQVTFALEITIAFVIDIDFEEQAQLSHNLDGGPCALPDVV